MSLQAGFQLLYARCKEGCCGVSLVVVDEQAMLLCSDRHRGDKSYELSSGPPESGDGWRQRLELDVLGGMSPRSLACCACDYIGLHCGNIVTGRHSVREVSYINCCIADEPSS